MAFGKRERAGSGKPSTSSVTCFRASGWSVHETRGEILALSGPDIYRINISICASAPAARQLQAMTAVLDTAAGAILISQESIPHETTLVPVEARPTLVNASGKTFR
jgi:hypothetical protein